MREFRPGERVKLDQHGPISRYWEVGVFIDAPYHVIDFACLGLDAVGHPFSDDYLIYYDRPEAPNGSIVLDNASNNGARFVLDLAHIALDISRIVFTATITGEAPPMDIFSALVGAGTPADIGDGQLLLSDAKYDIGVFNFSGQDFRGQKTLVIGEMYFQQGWQFIAIGQGLSGDLSRFMQQLSNGTAHAKSAQPVTVPAPKNTVPAPRPAAPAPPAPVRTPNPPSPAPPPRPTSQPQPPAPAPRPQPATPIVTPAPQPVTPVAPQPAPAPRPLARAAQLKRPPAPPPPLLHTVPAGGKLQDLIDAAAPGSTLLIQRGEYAGPIVINKPLVLDGHSSALWARSGPVVTISSSGVTLEDWEVEVTIPGEANNQVAVQISAPDVKLNDVNVRGGRIAGPDGDGEWALPNRLDLGSFAARAANTFRFKVRVPGVVRFSSPMDGVDVSPAQVDAGEHEITVSVHGVLPDTILLGNLEVKSASLTRLIPVTGTAVTGTTPVDGQTL